MSEQKVAIKSIVDAGDNVRHEIGDVTELAESISASRSSGSGRGACENTSQPTT